MAEIQKLSRMELIKAILKDPDRKSFLKMIREFFSLLLFYKEFPKHYFSRYLYKKDITNVRNHLPNKMISSITPFFNDKKIKEVVDNKLYFDLFFRQFNITMPAIFLYNHRNTFIVCYDNNRFVEVRNADDFKALLGEVFKDNPSCESLFIKKTYSSSTGRNTYKLSRHQSVTDTETIKDMYKEVIKSGFLFQETVRQHPVLDTLTTASLNTIRFDTFKDSDGKTEIISAMLKMSTTDSHVDNTMSGGCMVGVDLRTGLLKKFAYSKIKLMGVKVMTEHPVTGTKFENLVIPYFEEAKELVLKAAGIIPGLRLVGWDMAISENGPVIIEGNSDYGIKDNDLVDGGFLVNPVFRKVLKELHYI